MSLIVIFSLPLSMERIMRGKNQNVHTNAIFFFHQNQLNIPPLMSIQMVNRKFMGTAVVAVVAFFCLTHTAGFFQSPFTFLSFFCGIILSGTMMLHTYDSRCAKKDGKSGAIYIYAFKLYVLVHGQYFMVDSIDET